MTTIESELQRAIQNKDDFMPPPMTDLAQALHTPPSTFRSWFVGFQIRSGCSDWYLLNCAMYCGFLKYLEVEGLIDD